MARVTVTLPAEMVRDIERHERNRSRFILDAVRRELERRRREELRRSLREPHPDGTELADVGLDEWGALADPADTEDSADLLDPAAGRDVAWKPGEGWVERNA